MNFAKKAGEHFLQLFSQIYINNECVIATLGLTQPKQVPELAGMLVEYFPIWFMHCVGYLGVF